MSDMARQRTVEEYHAQWAVIATAYRLLEGLDLQVMLASVERADAVGPLLCPSEWIRGQTNLQPQRDVLRAAIIFTAAVERHIGKPGLGRPPCDHQESSGARQPGAQS